MLDLDICIVSGTLKDHPEIRMSDNGHEYSIFTIAMHKKFKSTRTGEYIESVQWVRCVVFLKHIVEQSKLLRRGNKVQVHGCLSIVTKIDKNMVQHHQTSIVVDKLIYHQKAIYEKPEDLTNK